MKLDRIAIFLPPSWNPAVPPLGAVAVASYARARGIPVRLRDMNPQFAAFLDRRFPGPGDPWDRGVEASRRLLGDLAARLKLKPGVVRNTEPFGYEVLVGFNKSAMPGFLASPDNVHGDFLGETRVLKRFDHGRNLVGFSLVADSQLLATLTAARRLKAANPSNVVVVGGPFVTLHAEAFSRADPLFADLDFAVPLDGELPFVALVRHLEGGLGGRIPGAVDRRGGAPVAHPPEEAPVAMDSLPTPDYRLLGRPVRHVVYETARGCPWGKCKFCYHIQYYGHRFVAKSIPKVVRDLAVLVRRHPGASVYFADSYLPPTRFKALAEAVMARGLAFDWWCMGKVQEGWDEGTFRAGREAGCRTIAWGLEHVNPRVTELIGKPIDVGLATRIFRGCRSSGIYPAVQTITGFPTETLEECRELLDYIDAMGDTFTSSPHMFGLAKKSPFHLQSEEYGTHLPDDPDQDLASLFPWRHPEWGRMAALIESRRVGPP